MVRYRAWAPFDWRPLRAWKVAFVVACLWRRANVAVCRLVGIPVRFDVLL